MGLEGGGGTRASWMGLGGGGGTRASWMGLGGGGGTRGSWMGLGGSCGTRVNPSDQMSDMAFPFFPSKSISGAMYAGVPGDKTERVVEATTFIGKIQQNITINVTRWLTTRGYHPSYG